MDPNRADPGRKGEPLRHKYDEHFWNVVQNCNEVIHEAWLNSFQHPSEKMQEPQVEFAEEGASLSSSSSGQDITNETMSEMRDLLSNALPANDDEGEQKDTLAEEDKEYSYHPMWAMIEYTKNERSPLKDRVHGRPVLPSYTPESPTPKGKDLRCRIEDCVLAFVTKEALVNHKFFEHADCYCEVCDLDFANHAELLSHRVNSNRHIACSEDGLEFASMVGLALHVDKYHPRTTHSDYPNVSVGQFAKMRVDRTIHQTMGAQELTTEETDEDSDDGVPLPRSPQKYGRHSYVSSVAVTSGSSSENEVEGCVVPITMPQPRLRPTRLRHLDGESNGSASDGEQNDVSPLNLTHQAANEPDDATAGLHLGHSGAALIAHEIDQDENLGTVEGLGHANDGLLTEEIVKKLPAAKREDIRRLATIMWGGMPRREARDAFDMESIGMREMNPWYSEFNAEYFRGPGGFLQCPYQSCRTLHDSVDKLRMHLKSGAHAVWFIRCPDCYTTYRKASDLIRHFDTTSSCSVKDQPWFPEILEIASSGFIGHDFMGSRQGHRLYGQQPQNVH